jgi:heme oxygenase
MNAPEVAEPKKKSKKGFVDQMRAVAMRLHTPQQSKQGKKKATEEQEKPVNQWTPTAEGYMKFLVESKAVYDRMESIVAEAPEDSAYHVFKNTGLERGARLAEDIEWLAKEKGLEIPAATGNGTAYADHLEGLAETDKPAFICHFYNVYFAHSAGGRMIGRKVSAAVLDGKELNFYQWDDLDSSLQNTKDKLNAEAEKWSDEQKIHCLDETEQSFKMSGKLLKYIAS